MGEFSDHDLHNREYQPPVLGGYIFYGAISSFFSLLYSL
jgi:hypothetical protein